MIFIAKDPVVLVLVLPILALNMLQSSDAGTYMCSPVLVPHMVGIALLPGAETPKVSTWQVPPRVKTPALPMFPFVLPVVADVENCVIGKFRANVSKSSLN